ncbi:MAG: hypothetical protein SFU53_02235 [Terrimicrobiaceae bacterium]|nr:hypothetical protein [Terrimicrobiaceae bacterium]
MKPLLVWMLLASLSAVNAQTNLDSRAADAEAAAARPLARLFAPSPDQAFRTAVSESGFPRLYRAVSEPKNSGTETPAGLRREGAWTYAKDPIPVTEADLRELQRIFAAERPFSPGDVSPCSSFRPAFLIEWTSAKATWLMHVGMDCQEADIRGPDVEMHRYLMPTTYGKLAAVLSRYTR